MSKVSDVFKKQILNLIPTRETLAAIRRLEAGKGIVLSYREWIDSLIRVYPEYTDLLEERYSDHRKFLTLRGGAAGPDSVSKPQRELVLDPRFEMKEALAKKHYKLTPLEILLYDDSITILRSKGILRKMFNAHSLKNKTGSTDLTDYWSFLAHRDVRKIPDEKKESVICLYKPTATKLYLANFGRHDKVYKQGSITEDFHKPDTKYVKVSLKDVYDNAMKGK